MAGAGNVFLALILNLADFAFAMVFAWVGVALFIAAYVMFFTKPRIPTEKRWRGQPLDDPLDVSPIARLWRWIARG